MASFSFPYVMGKCVLDVGCDMGYWSFLAAHKGADFVLGLDRNRDVRGVGPVDLIALNRRRAEDEGRNDVSFEAINLGKQWHEFGRFDIVLCLSIYHHWFECCGSHEAIWFWLWRHCAAGAQVIWEGPVDDSDPVVRANVSDENRPAYLIERITAAASRFFDYEKIGPALHEPTREVWRFRPQPRMPRYTRARMQDGAGGATAAFEYADGRRIGEIEHVLGWKPVPGSLNLALDGPFDWDEGYYRAQVFDVAERGKGLDVEWKPRQARFYPVAIDGVDACAFRFEGERYDSHFMELIAPTRLRDKVTGPRVTITR